MKAFTVAITFALASVATAQLENIPSCALQCLLSTLSKDGCPSIEDFKCHCQKADSLFASAIPCVQKSCSAQDQAAVISAVEGTCAGVGVPIQVPTPGGSSAPPSATPTSKPAETQMSETPSATPTPTPTPSPTPVPLPTPIGEPSFSSEVSEVSETQIVSHTPSGNGTMPSATPTISEFTGAAAQATQAVGILGAAALALLAL